MGGEFEVENMTLLVTYTCKPGQAGAYVQALKSSGVQEKIRAEDGCLRYDYHISCEAADTVVLLEQWRDEAAQQAHMAQPHMETVRQLKAAYVLDVQLDRVQ